MHRVFRIVRDHLDDQPPLPGILRDQLAPVVRLSPSGERELVAMRWGFPAPPGIGARPIGNIRKCTKLILAALAEQGIPLPRPRHLLLLLRRSAEAPLLVCHRSDAPALRLRGTLAALDRPTTERDQGTSAVQLPHHRAERGGEGCASERHASHRGGGGLGGVARGGCPHGAEAATAMAGGTASDRRSRLARRRALDGLLMEMPLMSARC